MSVAILNPARHTLDELVAQRDALRHQQMVELPRKIKEIQYEIDLRTAIPSNIKSITPRGRQVLDILLANEDYSNKEIGNMLNIAERTVKYHIAELLKRFGMTGYTRRDLIRTCRTF